MEILDEKGKILISNNKNITFLTIEGSDFITMFKDILKIDESSFNINDKKYLIVGILALKLEDEQLKTFKTISSNLNYSFVQNSFGNYIIIRKSLFTDDNKMYKTLDSITNYFNILLETQFTPLNLSDEQIIKNVYEVLFSIIIGSSMSFSNLNTSLSQNQTESITSSNPNVKTTPVKKQPPIKHYKTGNEDVFGIEEPKASKWEMFKEFLKYLVGEQWFNEHEEKIAKRKEKELSLYNKKLELEKKKLDLYKKKKQAISEDENEED
ncbi:MAG: hypothetical protein ACP5IV_07515 [Caldisericia bacterium]